jgi:hypothetical protein
MLRLGITYLEMRKFQLALKRFEELRTLFTDKN